MQQNQRENLMFWGLFEQDWPIYNKSNKPLAYKSSGRNLHLQKGFGESQAGSYSTGPWRRDGPFLTKRGLAQWTQLERGNNLSRNLLLTCLKKQKIGIMQIVKPCQNTFSLSSIENLESDLYLKSLINAKKTRGSPWIQIS